MHPDFAHVVDPLFAYVLNLLTRIQDSRADPPSADVERDLIKQQFSEAENRLAHSPRYSAQWELSKYALVVWTDEVLINAPWSGKQKWEAQPLEMEIFGSNEGAESYYRSSKDARVASFFDALEVYYLGVMLGFQGLYAAPNSSARAEQMGIPTSRKLWADEIGNLVGPKPMSGVSWEKRKLNPCSPLINMPWFIAALLLTIVMVAVTAVTFWYLHPDQGGSR